MELPIGSRSRMQEEFEESSGFRVPWCKRTPRHWFRRNLLPLEGVRESPELVRLGVQPGVAPSHKPPVRLFVGTEAGQSRGDRVFVWSVMQTRDPARVYEIYFMKDLKGYDRGAWKTGSSGYRYGVPTLAGGAGRAIYNDMNQIYLADPGELFDLDMRDAGVLSLSEHDSSVMLIDCERMLPHWSVEHAQQGKDHRFFRDILQNSKLRGTLPAEWNASDSETSLQTAKCMNFNRAPAKTERRVPDSRRYEPHLDREAWLSRERAADAAGFIVFTKDQPSRRYGEIVSQYRRLHEGGAANLSLPAAETFDGHSRRKHQDEILALITSTGARSLLDFGAGKGGGYRPVEAQGASSASRVNPAWPGVAVTCYDPGYEPFASPYAGTFDGVICTDVLEHIPEEDIPWVLHELFRSANKFVYASAACYPARKRLPNGENAHVTLQGPAWWNEWIEIVARRYPAVRWKLCSIEKGAFGKTKKFSESKAATVEAT